MPRRIEGAAFPIETSLTAIRAARGLSQAELAERAHLKRQQITYFETGTRVPSLGQLVRMARALDVPLQRLFSGSNRPALSLAGIALELRSLGLIDLWVESAPAPGAFRRPEEIVALAARGKEPEARIVEGLPSILAWNRWSPRLLRAHGREFGRAVVYRLAWLADIALAIERAGGFPGGCPGKEDLLQFTRRTRRPPRPKRDDLGRPADPPSASPLWRRWRINYAADLDTFRRRAQHLVTLARAEERPLSTWEE